MCFKLLESFTSFIGPFEGKRASKKQSPVSPTLDTNLLDEAIPPANLCTSLIVLGLVISCIALIFVGLASMPLSNTGTPKVQFLEFSLILVFLSLLETCLQSFGVDSFLFI